MLRREALLHGRATERRSARMIPHIVAVVMSRILDAEALVDLGSVS
jgi:hypothetical protein